MAASREVDKRSFERESGGGNVVPGAPLFFPSPANQIIPEQVARRPSGQHLRFVPDGLSCATIKMGLSSVVSGGNRRGRNVVYESQIMFSLACGYAVHAQDKALTVPTGINLGRPSSAINWRGFLVSSERCISAPACAGRGQFQEPSQKMALFTSRTSIGTWLAGLDTC